MAIFGWSSPQVAAIYTRKANKKKLVGAAIELINLKQSGNELSHSASPWDNSYDFLSEFNAEFLGWRPQGESNPCFSLERAAS